MAKPWYQKLFPHSPKPVVPVEAVASSHPQSPGGSAAAQYALGLHCANAPRGERDYEQAAQWYLKAAARNHALAQFNLGVMHGTGQGVPRDDAESERWFRRAAEQGDAGAQHRLGWLGERASFNGIGAAEAKMEAYKWYTLAAEQGYAGSNLARLTLTLRMAREQVAEGTRRATDFVAMQHADNGDAMESHAPGLNHKAGSAH